MIDFIKLTAGRPVASAQPTGSGRRAGTAILLGFAALLGSAAVPATASEPAAWQTGCAYRAPSGIPGVGQVQLNEMCARLRACQAEADQGNPNMARMGCFGFEPAQRGTKSSR